MTSFSGRSGMEPRERGQGGCSVVLPRLRLLEDLCESGGNRPRKRGQGACPVLPWPLSQSPYVELNEPSHDRAGQTVEPEPQRVVVALAVPSDCSLSSSIAEARSADYMAQPKSARVPATHKRGPVT